MSGSEMRQQPHIRKKIDPRKRKRMIINRRLILVLLITSILAIAAFAWNIYDISRSNQGAGKTQSLSADTNRSMKNDQYEIGNNPTAAEKQYFQQLTDALNAQDPEAISEAVVYNFVADYFTWTNKDGNYEIGGLQYIFGPKYTAFETWSRWNYYSDLDLYISQKGRANLIQVKEITTDSKYKHDDFPITLWASDGTSTETKYECYDILVSWTYESSPVSDQFPTGGEFLVVNDNGRWEIAEFYDKDYDWSGTAS